MLLLDDFDDTDAADYIQTTVVPDLMETKTNCAYESSYTKFLYCCCCCR